MLTPKLHQTIFGKKISSFHFFGAIGFIAGSALGFFLCFQLNLFAGVLAMLSLIGGLTFFALAILVKIITGEENIVYYHHEIGILAMCALFLYLFNLPVLMYLDITILGIAAFLAFGRLGCFSVGCCHGCPAKGGVVYGHEHVKAGFTRHYENIALFPVQLVESTFVFLVTIVGTFLMLYGVTPGTVLIIYTIGYGFFRFTLEFFRGDPDRPYWLGFSEAQWTTVGLFILSTLFSYFNWLPYYAWHLGLVFSLIALMVGVVIYRKKQSWPFYKFSNPHHIKEIASGISRQQLQPSMVDESIPVFNTSLGVQISSGKIKTEDGLITHYAVSAAEEKNEQKTIKQLPPKGIQFLAKLIYKLKHREAQMEIKEGEALLHHIIFKK